MNVRGFSFRVRTHTMTLWKCTLTSTISLYAFSQSQVYSCMGMTLNQLCTQPSASSRYVFTCMYLLNESFLLHDGGVVLRVVATFVKLQSVTNE